jgi:hypothetical protein
MYLLLNEPEFNAVTPLMDLIPDLVSTILQILIFPRLFGGGAWNMPETENILPTY